MDRLKSTWKKAGSLFEPGGRLTRFYPLYEMVDSFIYSPSKTTEGSVHLRHNRDLKAVMVKVAIGLLPCVFMSCYNTGLQANMALENLGQGIAGWRGDLFSLLGLRADTSSFVSNFFHGLLYFLPLYLVTQMAGGLCEVVFAVVRKHEINEGFLVTGLLYPLTLPPNLPLWQAAVGIIFGVVIGKEIFGGTGKNFLNPALTARAFIYFSYPADLSGDMVWTAVDGYTMATPLGIGALGGLESIKENYSWWDAFLGTIPGSLGETSTLACLLGAFVLLVTKVASWRIMVSVLLGMVSLSLLFNIVDSETNPLFSLTPGWHLVVGGFAFGAVFMATDPVSGSMTLKGQYIYGALIGVMSVLIRVLNPAFPEGVMLAILFANCFAPLIDYGVVQFHTRKRQLRSS